MSNRPRKNTYGQTLRVQTGLDLASIQAAGGKIWVIGSASSNVSAISTNTSAGTCSVGASTVAADGIVFTSGQYVQITTLGTNDAWRTADSYTFHVAISATSINYKSPPVIVSVDT